MPTSWGFRSEKPRIFSDQHSPPSGRSATAFSDFDPARTQFTANPSRKTHCAMAASPGYTYAHRPAKRGSRVGSGRPLRAQARGRYTVSLKKLLARDHREMAEVYLTNGYIGGLLPLPLAYRTEAR